MIQRRRKPSERTIPPILCVNERGVYHSSQRRRRTLRCLGPQRVLAIAPSAGCHHVPGLAADSVSAPLQRGDKKKRIGVFPRTSPHARTHTRRPEHLNTITAIFPVRHSGALGEIVVIYCAPSAGPEPRSIPPQASSSSSSSVLHWSGILLLFVSSYRGYPRMVAGSSWDRPSPLRLL